MLKNKSDQSIEELLEEVTGFQGWGYSAEGFPRREYATNKDLIEAILPVLRKIEKLNITSKNVYTDGFLSFLEELVK